MTCPSEEKWTLLSMNLLEPSQVSELNEHLLACGGCREKFRRARCENAALQRTYEALDRDHDELREQLLASLPEQAPPPASTGWGRRGWRRLGDYVMTNPKVRFTTATLAAATCIVFVVTLLLGSGQSLALAGVGRALQQTKSLVCQVSITITGSQLEQSLEGKTYMSDQYGSRTDLYQNGELIMCSISPLGGPTVSGQPGGGTKFRITHADAGGFEPNQVRPDDYILRLQELTGKAERSLGSEIIEGHQATGFEIAGQKLGLVGSSSAGEADASQVPALAHLWVDAATLLPVRYRVQIPGSEAGSEMTVVCEKFEWDLPLEASLFDPEVLEGDQGPVLDLKVPAATEEALIEGLGIYVEMMKDSYPSALDFVKIGMDFYQKVSAMPAGQRPDWGEGQDVMQRLMPLYAGSLYYQKLLREGAEAEYFGPSVKPGDAEAVLVRWRLDTGEQRVIYGDLHAETISAGDQ